MENKVGPPGPQHKWEVIVFRGGVNAIDTLTIAITVLNSGGKFVSVVAVMTICNNNTQNYSPIHKIMHKIIHNIIQNNTQ